MSKKNYNPKRDKDGKFKESSTKKATRSKKKTTVKKASKKGTMPAKHKVVPVSPPAAAEKPVVDKVKELASEPQEDTTRVQKAWDTYIKTNSQNVSGINSLPSNDPGEDAECYMGIYYQIVSEENQRIRLRVWNTTTGTWNNFTLNTDPTLSKEERQNDIRGVIFRAVNESKRSFSARGDIPAAHASH